MASAARCMRSLVRSKAFINVSVNAARTVTLCNTRSLASPSVTSILKEGGNILKGSKCLGLASKVNFTSHYAPVSTITSSISKTPPAAVDCGAESSDSLDGNLGDDDGETWSQSSDDPYIVLGP